MEGFSGQEVGLYERNKNVFNSAYFDIVFESQKLQLTTNKKQFFYLCYYRFRLFSTTYFQKKLHFLRLEDIFRFKS